MRYESRLAGAASGPGVADLAALEQLYPAASFGTVLLLDCLERVPRFWQAPEALCHLLAPGGRAFIQSSWAADLVDPQPGYWRISAEGLRSLFGDPFVVESIEAVPEPGALRSVAIQCAIRLGAPRE